MNLNKSQKEAIEYGDGQLLILAGAGSGKTRVITQRIIYLLKNGVSPKNILAVTFTNKASKEMQERISSIVKSEIPNISTFHSACGKILRSEISLLGFKSNFIIYDDTDSDKLIKEIITQQKLDTKVYNAKNISLQISSWKNEGMFPEDIVHSGTLFEKKIIHIYKSYQNRLKASNAIDFGDMILKVIEIFTKFPERLSYYQNLYKYVLVDEYQDTNPSQYQMLSLLCNKKSNLCVVGDDDQAIYSWRGADISNILDFKKDYPNAKVVKLEENYRCTGNILEAAYSVIKINTRRSDKKIFTSNENGSKIKYKACFNDIEESRFIASEINKLKKSKISYEDIAVLYRANYQSRLIEEELIKAAIPYKIIGGIKFYARAEIKDLLAYMRVIENNLDSIALERIINTPVRGIGATIINKLKVVATENKVSLWEAIDLIELKGNAKTKIVEFKNMIKDFEKEKDDISKLINSIIAKTKYIIKIKEEIKEIENSRTDSEERNNKQERVENIEQFITSIYDFKNKNPESSLSDFLEHVTLVTDTNKDSDESVTLMTLHSAKGLEYKVVFLPGMEEGVFPHGRTLGDQTELEEERRLCYVGITRAKELLYLVRATKRLIFNKYNFNEESRFIKNIPLRLIDKS